jgi:hypothetical protein
MQSRFSNSVSCCAMTLLLAFASLSLASLVFLFSRDLGEPPTLSIAIGVGTLLIGELVVLRDGNPQYKIGSIALGAIVAWIMLPEIGGRYESKVAALFSVDRLHFGAVTFTIAGGAVGSIAECLCARRRRTPHNVTVTDSTQHEGRTMRST